MIKREIKDGTFTAQNQQIKSSPFKNKKRGEARKTISRVDLTYLKKN